MRKRRLLYIISPGYSGSTVTNLLIATHPDVATIGERRYLKHRMVVEPPYGSCTCGLQVGQCEFMKNAYDAGRRTLPWYMRHIDYVAFDFSQIQYVKGIMRKVAHGYYMRHDLTFPRNVLIRPFHALCRANAALVDFVLDSESAPVFLDSSKSTLELEFLSASGLFDITPIHLSRDGRGQFHSAIRHHPDLTPEVLANRFRMWRDRIETTLNAWSGPYVRLKYEDLCDHPVRELRRVAEEVGLDPDGMSLDFRNGSKHIIGNKGVVQSSSSRIVNEELWKTELTPDQLAIFEEIAGDSNRWFGYEG